MKRKMKTRVKSCLSWFGSDAGVAPELAALLNDCKHVGIAFFGGGSIVPHLNAGLIVANDIHADAVNFYRVVSGRYGHSDKQQLIDACDCTLSHPAELREAWRVLREETNRVRRAWGYWAACWLAQKGAGGTKNLEGKQLSFRWTATGGGNASRITSAAAGLSEWGDQFKRCEFTEFDFREFGEKLKDKEGCGSYWDPPWVGAGEAYDHPFTEQDHRDMAEIVRRYSVSKVVIRYGDHPLVRELYGDGRWNIIQASSRNQANAEIDELWITNFFPS